MPRKELGDLLVDLAATPKPSLVCRASPCLAKEEARPDLPFITTSPYLIKEIPQVVVICSAKCKIGYHTSCWNRTVKQQRKKGTLSSRAGGSKQTIYCPTPDFHDFVLRVEEKQ